ncbi:MAG: magnesium-protoporphyrin IX monomethyl ester anaerobic oxidative cyclase [Pseudomonas sp.]|uniref:magnesium-protoporphyrin IX monomethyl ester anaerobic oxidative cyclase n=1 Tax=Pseudomonas sp. TaxID=306 RepID=UPI0039828293
MPSLSALPFKVVLINPPHTAIGSRIPGEHLPPLGLLCVGGPLLDAGFRVELLDADREALELPQIVARVRGAAPDVVLLGHSGSSSVHATVLKLCRLLKQSLPGLTIIYGGVHPTYHWREILQACPEIDFIVRGEGEQTALSLLQALQRGEPLIEVQGIALRYAQQVIATPAAAMLRNLDEYRVGWELIDHAQYSYWGGKRAVVVQFSRGCPHLCNYCGQRGFWTQWRHRDPVKLAQELARLHREDGVELINFADELPTGSRKLWKQFLEALIAENVPLLLVGSTRAGDIVRDADILHLYRQAGGIRFLLGIESYDEATLAAIRKGGSVKEDQRAIELLRQHGIVSMATYVVGFQEETDRDYWRSLKHLLRYDPDQIQLLYVTPHRWTPFYETAEHRRVIQTDTRRWDYKHQVLEVKRVPAWRVFLWFKLIEVCMQARPKALGRLLFHRDADFRHAMRWYTQMGRRVWFHEVAEFIGNTRLVKSGPSLREFLGHSLADTEYALDKRKTKLTQQADSVGERVIIKSS